MRDTIILCFAVSLCSGLFLCPGDVSAQDSSTSPSTNTAVAANSAVSAELAAMPLAKLLKEARKTSDKTEQAKFAAAIAARKPVNTKEAELLFDALDASAGPEERDSVRGAVAGTLGNVTDMALVPVFIKQIKHGDFLSCGIAIDMVVKLKAKEAVPALIDLVSGKELVHPAVTAVLSEKLAMRQAFTEGLRMQAAEALGDLGDERAIPVLIKKLGKMEGEESKALAKFGIKVLPQLLEIQRDSKNEKAQDAAASAILYMQDKAVLPVMWDILTMKKEGLRLLALRVLLSNCDATTTPSAKEVEAYLIALYKKDSHFLADTIFWAQENKRVDILIGIAQDTTLPVSRRTFAIEALGDIKDDSAVPVLEQLLSDGADDIRYFSRKVLKKLTGKSYPEK